MKQIYIVLIFFFLNNSLCAQEVTHQDNYFILFIDGIETSGRLMYNNNVEIDLAYLIVSSKKIDVDSTLLALANNRFGRDLDILNELKKNFKVYKIAKIIYLCVIL